MENLDGWSPDQLPIEELKRLSLSYQVVRWKRLLPKRDRSEDSQGLGRIYLVTCGPLVNIPAACGAFSQLSDWVEYAEPDSMVQIQSGGSQGVM